MINLIGLAGKMASGKTTASKVLEKEYGFRRRAYADPLKETAMSLFELSANQVYELADKNIVDPRYNKTPREIMQLFGTECVRNHIHPDFWVMKMQWFISKNATMRIVVDDVRFDNEADLIRNLGGVIIHMTREEDPFKGTKASEHISENSIFMKFEDFSIHAHSHEEVEEEIRIMAEFFGISTFKRN